MSGQQIKMLSLDDRTITTDLDRAGYRAMGVYVRPAATFQDAEELLKNESIDIIVINYDYERVNAPLVCEHFKKHYPDVPVVITSVQTNAETKKSSLNAGADLFVEQPVPRQYFIEKLKKQLEQKTRGQERVPFTGEAVVKIDGKEQTIEIGDLSSSGLLLATDMILPTGLSLEIDFVIPGYKKPISVRGEVVRRIPPDPKKPKQMAGIGIRFAEFIGDSQKRLERFVSKTTDQDARMIYYL